MPFYEYFCPDNNTIYTFLARTLAMGKLTPDCPENPEFRMVRRVSGFAITGKAREEAGGDDMELDPRMEQALGALEKEFSGLNDDNPDPKQLGYLMRRMSDVMGEKLPASMEEMAARLEAGEDPDRLEEEYGDRVDDDMEAFGDSAGENAVPGNTAAKALHMLRRRPRRDPKVYEMRDFV